VGSAAQDDALDGADVIVVAPPGQDDVLVEGELVVRRVEVDPAETGTEERDPGVRGLGAGEGLAARRRVGAKVAADVARGQAE
jgi:hypothetical protein